MWVYPVFLSRRRWRRSIANCTHIASCIETDASCNQGNSLSSLQLILMGGQSSTSTVYTICNVHLHLGIYSKYHDCIVKAENHHTICHLLAHTNELATGVPVQLQCLSTCTVMFLHGSVLEARELSCVLLVVTRTIAQPPKACTLCSSSPSNLNYVIRHCVMLFHNCYGIL